MQVKTCPNCRIPYTTLDRYCGACGCKLPPPKLGRLTVAALTLLPLGLIVAAVVVVALNPTTPDTQAPDIQTPAAAREYVEKVCREVRHASGMAPAEPCMRVRPEQYQLAIKAARDASPTPATLSTLRSAPTYGSPSATLTPHRCARWG
jgi:hypothetical protein